MIDKNRRGLFVGLLATVAALATATVASAAGKPPPRLGTSFRGAAKPPQRPAPPSIRPPFRRAAEPPPKKKPEAPPSPGGPRPKGPFWRPPGI